jgi:stage III sporulation protein AE
MRLTGAIALAFLFLEPVSTLIQLGADTVQQISDYSKLLLPVMTTALAAQGGTTTSAALYTGTAFFNALLTTVIANVIVPTIYLYLALCIAHSALGQELLKKIRDNIKWAMTWLMKWILYIFTGYLSITGVVSGSVDSSVLKAAKISISGAVPVVGGILSDATETILVSAGLMKNAAGVYGIFAVISICIGPFVKIGMQYLLLKLTAAITDTLDYKSVSALVQDFSTGMGFVVAMTGTVCVLLLVSIVCFMKGLGI